MKLVCGVMEPFEWNSAVCVGRFCLENCTSCSWRLSVFLSFFSSDLSFQSTFPVRDELLSDLSDDDVQLAAKTPEVRKHTVISFKHKDDTDLFGLGIQEEAPAAKDSSEEQEGNSLMISRKSIFLAII